MTSQFKLEGPVSATNDVEPSDSRKVKRALMRLGHLDSADVVSLDFVDTPLLEGVKSFQEEKGLRVDGVVKPGGPTEGMIARSLRKQDKVTKTPGPSDSAGMNRQKLPRPRPKPTNKKPDPKTPITAKPSGIVVFKYPGQVPPSHESLDAAFGKVENKTLPDDPRRKIETVEPPFVQEKEGPEAQDEQDDCLIRCISEQLGIDTIIGMTAVVAGHPTIKKRFVMKGSSEKHSVASKYLPKAVPERFKFLPKRVWTPTTKRPFAITKLTGAVIARWILWVGWGLLANDVIQIARCVHRCKSSK